MRETDSVNMVVDQNQSNKIHDWGLLGWFRFSTLCHRQAHCEYCHHVCRERVVWPLVDALGRLQEAGVVGLFQGLVGLRDEGRRPLNALLAVGYLLRELPKPLRLERRTNGQSEVWVPSCSDGSSQWCIKIIKPRLECWGLLGWED